MTKKKKEKDKREVARHTLHSQNPCTVRSQEYIARTVTSGQIYLALNNSISNFNPNPNSSSNMRSVHKQQQQAKRKRDRGKGKKKEEREAQKK